MIDYIFVHQYNDKSGSPRVLSDLINCHFFCNKKIKVFTSQHDGFLSDINKIVVPYFRFNNKLLVFFSYILNQICLFFFLIFFVSKEIILFKNRPVIIVNTLMPFSAHLVAYVFGLKSICYCHETLIKPYVLKFFLRFIINNCSTFVIFVSKYLSIEERFSKPGQGIIYNGLRSDLLIPSSIDFRSKFNKKRIFFAGSLKKYKGIFNLIELAILLPNINFDVALNADEFSVLKFKEKNKIPPNVYIYVRPENISELYLNSFFVLNLSIESEWIETFGLTLLEGMSFASVPIGPTVGGPVDFISDSCGFLTSSNNITSIKNFIELLSDNYSIWEYYAKNSLLVADTFSFYEYQKDIEHLFNTEF